MAEVNLAKFLDKEHENKPLADVLKLPASSLQGVTEKDADALKSAFGIRIIEDMGKNKHFKAAQNLVEMVAFSK